MPPIQYLLTFARLTRLEPRDPARRTFRGLAEALVMQSRVREGPRDPGVIWGTVGATEKLAADDI